MASRKEYKALAIVVRDLGRHWGQPSSRHIIAAKMADWYEADNENFDRDRFYEACEVDTDSVSNWARDFDQRIRNHKERICVKN